MTVARAGALLLVALSLLLLGSCAGRESSVTLSLSLSPGMERTMRFTTEQQVKGAALGASAIHSSFSISFTYRFRVSSVEASGLAKVETAVTDVTLSKGMPAADALLESLRGQRFVATIDRNGHVLDLRVDGLGGVALPGLPRTPGALTQNAPAQGDMGALFGGLNGQKVSVGETWTTPLPQSLSSGLRGSVRWTLASVAGSTARLDYTGTLEKQQVPIPTLPGDSTNSEDSAAMLVGDASGFVELEKTTGWPRRGQSVIRAEVIVGNTRAPAGTDSSGISMRIVTRFDALP